MGGGKAYAFPADLATSEGCEQFAKYLHEQTRGYKHTNTQTSYTRIHLHIHTQISHAGPPTRLQAHLLYFSHPQAHTHAHANTGAE